MKKLIIVAWGALLLLKQGTIIGMGKDPTFKIGNVDIIIQQGDINEIKNIDAIVNLTKWNLWNTSEITDALRQTDILWGGAKQKRFLVDNPNFRPSGRRAVITPTSGLKKRGVLYMIEAVGRHVEDEDLKKELEKTYPDVLETADEVRPPIRSIIFSPIDTSIFEKDEKTEQVIITPATAANIAISAVNKFINDNPNSPLEKIYFTSRKGDESEHYDAYVEAIKNLSLINNPIRVRSKTFAKKMKEWRALLAVGALATLAASLYLLKKYYPSP